MPEQHQPKSETFCGVCRHPTGVGEGHYQNCPVYTGEPQSGTIYGIQALAAQDQAVMQQAAAQQQHNSLGGAGYYTPNHGSVIQDPLSGLERASGLETACPYCGGVDQHIWAGPQGCPGARTPRGRTYQDHLGDVAQIYREAKERLLEELKIQREVNRLLAKELLALRLTLAQLKLKHGIVLGEG